MKIILLIAILANTYATEVPTWVLAGILKQESRSYYSEDGRIVYINKAIGADGELSAFQIKRIAWKQVKRKGEKFEDLATDQVYAEQIAIRYLVWLYEHSAKRDWAYAIQYYNAGPGKRRYSYYVKIIRHAKKAGYETPNL